MSQQLTVNNEHSLTTHRICHKIYFKFLPFLINIHELKFSSSFLCFSFLNTCRLLIKIKTAIYLFSNPHSFCKSTYQLIPPRTLSFIYENSDEDCFTREYFRKIKVQDVFKRVKTFPT